MLARHPVFPLLVSSSLDTTVRVWDLESRACLHTLVGHTRPVWALAIDPSGRRLASRSRDLAVRIWDLSSGACLHVLDANSTGLEGDPVWNASGTFIATRSSEAKIHLWDAASGALRHTLEGHSGAVNAILAHPADDFLASGSDDRSVRVWRWSSGECLRVLEGHTDCVTCLYSLTSLFVSTAKDKSQRSWSWTSGGSEEKVALLLNEELAKTSFAVEIECEERCTWDTSVTPPIPLRVQALSPRTPWVRKAVGDGRAACSVPDDDSSIVVWGE